MFFLEINFTLFLRQHQMLEWTIDHLRNAYIFLTRFSFVFEAFNFHRKIRNSVKFNTIYFGSYESRSLFRFLF
jgi:hypothetical protein